jgi:hypothetical protein
MSSTGGAYGDLMSRLVGAVLAVVLLVVAVAAFAFVNGESPPSDLRPEAETSATPGPATLRPNMRSLEAFDFRIRGTDDRRRLRFSAALANLGPGPMVVEPSSQVECPARQRGAEQVLYLDGNDDDVFQRGEDRRTVRREAGCMLDHPTHDHWHFDAMAGYSLRLPGTTEPLVSRDKVSFCLRDNTRVPDAKVQQRREYFGDCRRNGPQGISPGWTDVYEYDLDGQSLRLPDFVDDAVVCVDLEADPMDLLEESDEDDNATSIAIEVSGDNVSRASDQDVCSLT